MNLVFVFAAISVSGVKIISTMAVSIVIHYSYWLGMEPIANVQNMIPLIQYTTSFRCR